MLEHKNATPTAPERTVVLGSNGFVGAALMRRLADAGAPALGLTRSDIELLAPEAAAKLAAVLRPTDALVAVAADRAVQEPRHADRQHPPHQGDCRGAGAVSDRARGQHQLRCRLRRWAAAALRGFAGRADDAARRHASGARDRARRGCEGDAVRDAAPHADLRRERPSQRLRPQPLPPPCRRRQGHRALRRGRGAARPRAGRRRGRGDFARAPATGAPVRSTSRPDRPTPSAPSPSRSRASPATVSPSRAARAADPCRTTATGRSTSARSRRAFPDFDYTPLPDGLAKAQRDAAGLRHG